MLKFFGRLAEVSTLAFACTFALYLGLAQAQNSGTFPSASGGAGNPAAPSGSVQYNASGSFGGISGASSNGTGLQITGNGALSSGTGPITSWTGTAITGGTATTTKPLVLIEPTGTTSTNWPTTGTFFGINAPGASGGFLFLATSDAGVGGSPIFGIHNGGASFNTVIEQGSNSLIFANGGVWQTQLSNIGFQLTSAGQLVWGNASGSSTFGTNDTWIARPAPANIQLGGTDTGGNAVVAQTVSVISVAAGNTNTAGADWTFNASKGTGTGVGGNIIFQTAPAGTTGSSQNAYVQVEIIDSKGHIRVGNQTAPALTACGTSPSIIGDDTAGEVTMGTGTPTGCVITFKTAYAAAPLCIVAWQAQALASQSWTVSASAITTVQTATNSDKINYICRARNGG